MNDPITLPPGLYIVATPIGNLRDITLRALDVLGACSTIACEDTRQTAKLLSHYGIKAKTQALHDHNEAQQSARLVAQMEAGAAIALVSDAGTPLISDPGYKLVCAAQQAGLPVFTIPGASALTAALSIAGLPTDRFFFAGFLPPKSAARRKAIEKLITIPATLVFYESPRRLPESLQELAEVLGEREASICRELTKIHEEVHRATLTQLAQHYQNSGEVKGEVVILIAPPAAEKIFSATEIDRILRQFTARGLSTKDAASEAARFTGLPRKQLYGRVMEMLKKS